MSISESTCKNLLVTGAGSGIGMAAVQHFATQGYRIFAGVRRDQDSQALRNIGLQKVIPVRLDVTDEIQVKAVALEIAQSVGETGLQGLVNNAGLIVEGPLEQIPITDLRRQFEVNVIGQITVTQAFLPLIRRGRGRIINMGAASGRTAVPFLGPIASSKAAMESLTDALRMELSAWQIPVSIIEPGAIQTDIFSKAHMVADRNIRLLPAEEQRLYAASLENARTAMEKGGADKIEVVINAIEQALTAPRPKTRYVVGKGAGMLVFLRLLPDRLRDSMMIGQMGLTKFKP